jgi:hypothetical protein
MRSLLAVFLSFTLLTCSFKSEVFAQNSKPETKPFASDFKPSEGVPVAAEEPVFLWECEGNQCVSGGGGAIWVFEGNRGQGVWRYGAVADLILERPNKKAIMVHRSDPIDSYSTAFTGGQQFKAEYGGEVVGRQYRGTIIVGPFKDKWYGGFTDSICGVGDECPLDARHLVELGENALRARLYHAAFASFKSASAKGDHDAEAFAGLMLRDGTGGVTQNPAEGIRMLLDSAEHDSINGQRGLAETYEFGIGTPKNPGEATRWKHEAVMQERHLLAQAQARDQQARARAQAECNKATSLLIGATVLALIVAALASGNSGSGESAADKFRHNDDTRNYWYNEYVQQCEAGDGAACNRVGMSPPSPDR